MWWVVGCRIKAGVAGAADLYRYLDRYGLSGFFSVAWLQVLRSGCGVTLEEVDPSVKVHGGCIGKRI